MKLLLCTLTLGVIALTACAPIPIPGKIYVPEYADGSAMRTSNDTCVFNQPEKRAIRQVDNIEIIILEPASELNNKDGQADFLISARRAGKPVAFTVDPVRVRLLDEGRQLTPKAARRPSNTNAVALKFPAPSGDAKRVTMSFQSGAIRVQGRAIDLTPVTFRRVNDPTIWIFPCIPA